MGLTMRTSGGNFQIFNMSHPFPTVPKGFSGMKCILTEPRNVGMGQCLITEIQLLWITPLGLCGVIYTGIIHPVLIVI